MAPQLVAALRRLDYPTDRLEILFVLEANDPETLEALEAQALPAHMRPIVVPDVTPRTKPRALNHALGQANGEFVVVYDAEDRPHPGQLREAIARFARGGPGLACLQAPLRPDIALKGFVARQFALEYAVQFDVLLPALHRLNLPFPLGGTSNHLKIDILRRIGGWDAYNVTEDADLGLRLAQFGYRSEMIVSPTFEMPPRNVRSWIPQRTRWIKGHMQTIGVHTRLQTRLRPRVGLGLVLGVVLSVAASIGYAPLSMLLLTRTFSEMLAAIFGNRTPLPFLALFDIGLFSLGTLTGLFAIAVGAQRAGIRLRVTGLLLAPFYWGMQSVAAAFATVQLTVQPHHWDKTDHVPLAENDFTKPDATLMP